jgi:ABC-type transporter Mla subunit MlaD
LFVLGGLVALGVLIVLFGESRGLFHHRYIVKAKFDRVTELREGTDVKLAGVWAGSVLRVELVDPLNPTQGVFAHLDIDQKFSVPKGSVATVVTPLMGQPTINIIPPMVVGVPPEPLPRDGTAQISGQVTNPLEQVINPVFMATMEKTTGQIGVLAEALTPAANALAEFLKRRTVEEVEAPGAAQRGITANLYTTVERLQNVLKHIETVFGDPAVQSNLKETMANFKAASEEAKEAAAGFKAFSESAQQTAIKVNGVATKLDATVDTAHQHIDRLGKSLSEDADKLGKLLDYGIAAGRQLSEGEGTAALLLRDPKFYEELLLTTQRLGAAASELQVLIKQWQDKGLLGVK